MPHGTLRNLSFVSLTSRSCVATPSRNASSNMNVSARPSFTAETARAGESTSSSFVFLKQFLVQAAYSAPRVVTTVLPESVGTVTEELFGTRRRPVAE